MDKVLAARRLSAALGMKITPQMIESVADDGLLRLKEGSCFQLCAGNVARKGPTIDDEGEWVDGFWLKNGKVWNPHSDEEIRDLPGAKKGLR